MLTLKQFTGSLVTPTDDALFYDFLISGQCGIFEGCEVTHLGANQLRVSSGRGVILGRIFTVEEETIQAAVSPGGEVDGRLLIRVDVANGEKPIEFVTQAETPLPGLTQEDINRDGSVYELPLAVYKVTELLISGLERVAEPVQTPIDDSVRQAVQELQAGKFNAAAQRSGTTVAITGPAEAQTITFPAPADWTAGDSYTYNGQPLTLTDLNREPVEDAWKAGSPVTFYLSGGAAFFKAGGAGKVPADLPPLLPGFSLEFSGTTVTVTAQKLPANEKTAMLSGGVWVLGSAAPDSPKGEIRKEWSRSDLVDETQAEETDETVTWTYEGWSAGEPVYARQYTYNAKGQYNTSLYGGLVSTEDAPPFALPEFTGNHAIFGDEVSGRIELYESGDLTLYPGTYDLFLIGGGGSGIFGGYDSSEQTAWHTGLGGGGSGYTKTFIGEKVDSVINVECVVGAGGAVNTTANNQANLGSSTYLKFSTGNMKEAKGGGNYNSSPYVQSENGQNGGSGGGAGQGDGSRGGVGGSDGSNGGNSPYGPTGGIGQGTTTKAFGEDSQTLYAGGGGGPGLQGGSGGGGRGAQGSTSGNTSATSGTPNTGSGGGCGYRNSRYNLSAGAGGSGLIIIRWSNV